MLSPQRPQNPAHQQLLHLGVLCLFIIICYYPSLDVPFIFDDFANIVANQAVHPESAGDLGKALSSTISGTRPLAMLSFALNYLYGYLDVFGYHLVNILIHLINAILLYRILVLLPVPKFEANTGEDHLPRINIAFWGAALWAVNPVQTQAVTYIVQRMTSMATLFYLAGILFFLSWRRGMIAFRLMVAGVIFSFLLGLASKEIIITLPLALLLLDFLFFPAESDRKKTLVLSLAIITILTMLGLLYLRGQLPAWHTTYTNRNFSPAERIMTQWRVVWHYVSLFFLPIPSRLHLAYDPVVSRGIMQPWTTAAGVSAMLFTWYLTWRWRKKHTILAFGIFFFFLAQIIESSFINLELAFIHRLYLPSLFLIFAALSLLPPRVMKVMGIPLLALLALWSYWTIERNGEWDSAQNFWQDDLARGAGPARALNNQAAVLIDTGRYEEAIPILKAGLPSASTTEERKDILYNLGVALYITKRYDGALRTFQEILRKNGPYLNTLLYIGQALLSQNKKAETEKIVRRLNELPEKSHQGAILQANIFTTENRFSEAEALLLTAIEQESPAQLGAWLRLQLELAAIYLKENKNREAYEIYLRITRKFPQNTVAWKQIYFMLVDGGDTKGAAVIKRYLETRGVRFARED
jgi:tetratricopeptide (TPR) repeat protein